MSEAADVSPPTKPARVPGRLRRRLIASLPWLLLAGVVIGDGADRTPADATAPVDWRGPAPAAGNSDVLRIATFNIHGGRGADGRLDLRRTATQLGDVDVAWLQEVHGGGWTGGVDQAGELGQRLQISAAFLPTERRWWTDHFGNGLLTRLPVDLVQRCPLPGTRGKAFRQAVLTEVMLRNQRVRILGVHVDREQDRVPQLEIVSRLFLALEPPAILLGDLNTQSDDPALQTLLAAPDVIDPLSEVAESRGHIDWILARGLECRKIESVTGDASDHPAVRAEFTLPAAR